MLAKEDIQKEWQDGLLLAPAVDIYETKDDFVMKLLMPGVKKDTVEVKMDNDELMIYGRVPEELHVRERVILNEIDTGNYYRVFKVSDSVDVEQIKAKMDDGILIVTLPKHERTKPREIPIEIA